MRYFIFWLFQFCIFFQGNSQKADTIVTMRGKIIAHVKEVTPDLIAYSNPEELVVYKVERGSVAWISFGSGRTERYNDLKSFASIDDPRSGRG